MANEFVAPPERLTGRIHAQHSTLIVLLRNGKPYDVLLPGRRVMRGFGVKLVGEAQAMQVNTASVTRTFVVRDVRTADRIGTEFSAAYALPSVTVAVVGQIAQNQNYAAFRAFLEEHQGGFDTALITEFETVVDAHVRGLVGQYTHDELYGRTLAPVLNEGLPTTIGNGVFEVKKIAVQGFQWSQAYLDAVKAKETSVAQGNADTVKIATDLMIGKMKVSADAELLLTQVLALGPAAAASGSSLGELLNPEREREKRLDAIEVLKALGQNPTLVALLRQDGQRPLADIIQAGLGPGAGAQDPPIPPAVTAQASAPPLSIATSAGSTQLELATEPRLRRAWVNAIGDSPKVLGITGAAAVGSGWVAVVLDRDLPASVDPSQAQADFIRTLRTDDVRVSVLVGTDPGDLVQQWLAQMGLPAASTFDVTHGDNTMTIELAGPARELKAFVDQLNSPQDVRIQVFESLLSVDTLVVRLQGA